MLFRRAMQEMPLYHSLTTNGTRRPGRPARNNTDKAWRDYYLTRLRGANSEVTLYAVLPGTTELVTEHRGVMAKSRALCVIADWLAGGDIRQLQRIDEHNARVNGAFLGTVPEVPNPPMPPLPDTQFQLRDLLRASAPLVERNSLADWEQELLASPNDLHRWIPGVDEF